MRTFLTRLTFSAAGVVLTGVGMTAAAYASEDDLSIIDDGPIYMGETPSLPPVDQCEIEFTIEDCGPSIDVDDGFQRQLPDGAELIDPGSLGGDSSESGDDTSDGTTGDPVDGGSGDSEGGGSDEPADSEGAGAEDSAGAESGETSGEPGTTEDGSETDDGGTSARGESSGDAGDTGGDSPSDGSGEPAAEDVAEDPAPEPDETTVAPAAQSASSDSGGTSDLLFFVLVGALAAFGLGMVTLGFVRRNQPAGNRRR